jgi:glyoxylate reductase
VAELQPMNANNPLVRRENGAVTSYIGSAIIGARNAMTVLCTKNVIADLKRRKITIYS